MELIINAVFSEIAHCSHLDPQKAPLRACIDSKVESLALTGMEMVRSNTHSREENKLAIRQLVQKSIEDCTDSLSEIGYDTAGWDRAQQCIMERGGRLVDMAVDLMTDTTTPEDDNIMYEGARDTSVARMSRARRVSASKLLNSPRKRVIASQRCSQRKSILKRSPSRRRRASVKRVVWKK